MAAEIELKLAVPAGSLKALQRHPLVAAAVKEGPAQTLRNTYYDTPELDLRAAKMAVRTRRAGRQLLQTVKCASASVGGLTVRPEWEQPFENERFDFSAVDDPAAKKLLTRHYDRIQPVFDTDFRRETRIFTPREGVRIAIMIDTGSIRAAGREMPLSEVELELYEGDRLDLLDLALELCDTLPLYPEDESKAQRGYRLFTDSPVPLAKSRPFPVRADQRPLDAFRASVFDCMGTWQANVAGVRTTDDPAFVHQLRVALRRLRSLLRLFAPILPKDFRKHWLDLIGQLADEVGLARDLDVMHTTVLRPVMDAGLGANSGVFSARLMEERQAAREHGRSRLQEPRIARRLLELTRDLLALPDTAGDMQLDAFALDALRKVRKDVRRAMEAAETLDAEPLHALRIRIKRLRYALECFSPLLPADRVALQLKEISDLQEDLGFLNDMAVASRRLAGWAGDDPLLISARAYILGWHAPKVHDIRSGILKRCARMLEGRPAWQQKKGKAR